MFKKQSRCKLQTNLEKCLLAGLLAVIFLLLVLLLSLTIKLTAVTPCKTRTCISEANEILNNIDPVMDPCDDFFKFACGSIIKRNDDANLTKKLKNDIKNDLNKLMRQHIKSTDHYLVKNQKTLFQACMNETGTEEATLDIFKKLLIELNGWPVIEGAKWDQNQMDWINISYKLRQKGLLYSSMLEIDTEPDPLNLTNYLVHVKEPFMDIIEDKRRSLYLKYMVDEVVLLGAERQWAENDMMDVYGFTKKLENVTGENDWNDDNTTAEILTRRLTVKEFQNQSTQINWLDFINEILHPSSKVSEDDYVLFPKAKFVDALFDLLNSTPKRVQVNYILWNLFESLVDFFPSQFQHLHKNYNCLTDSPINKMTRFDFCKNIVQRSFELIPTDMIYAEQKPSLEYKRHVEELIKNVKAEFNALLEQSSWMDEESKKNALKKGRVIGEVIGTYQDYFEGTIVKSFDASAAEHNESESFLNLYLLNRKLLTDMTYARVNYCDSNNYRTILNKLANTVNAVYSPERNTIILHAGILQPSFFNPYRPNYRNYAMLGTIIGHEIAHAFCKEGSMYDENGTERTIWTKYTTQAYEEQIKCIINEVEDFVIGATELKINSTRTLEENTADYAGVKASYNAYRNWVVKNGEEPPLIGLEYTANQLFWISSTSHYCYKVDEKDLENVIKRDPHALNVFRVNGPLRNNEEFAKDFNCPLGSNMNPSTKCGVF